MFQFLPSALSNISNVVLFSPPTAGMFQKFKKSLSLRLTKKSGSRSESPSDVPATVPAESVPVSADSVSAPADPATLPRRRGSAVKDEDGKAVYL